MPTDERITAYIAKAAPFARPILEYLRALVHAAVPEATETIKWGMPFFEHQRRPLAMMAAFKGHAGLGIFDGSPMAKGDGMGQFGRLTSVADLPDAAVVHARLLEAAQLAAAGKPAMRRPSAPKPALTMPDDLAAALAAEPAAEVRFSALTPGAQREYLEWVLGAKQMATRMKRIGTSVEQVAAGKKLNWRYENC
jgi:uncharacterized protein YdhG (YjbR/CyaY superfamily)